MVLFGLPRAFNWFRVLVVFRVGGDHVWMFARDRPCVAAVSAWRVRWYGPHVAWLAAFFDQVRRLPLRCRDMRAYECCGFNDQWLDVVGRCVRVTRKERHFQYTYRAHDTDSDAESRAHMDDVESDSECSMHPTPVTIAVDAGSAVGGEYDTSSESDSDWGSTDSAYFTEVTEFSWPELAGDLVSDTSSEDDGEPPVLMSPHVGAE